MGYKTLLTLDLENGVSSESRQKVYAYLKESKWKKLNGLTTTWTCSFKDDVTRAEAINQCKEDVSNAVHKGRVSSYNAALQVGKGDIEEF